MGKGKRFYLLNALVCGAALFILDRGLAMQIVPTGTVALRTVLPAAVTWATKGEHSAKNNAATLIGSRFVPATSGSQTPITSAPTTTPSSSSSGSTTVAPPPAPASPVILFADDFETPAWNGLNAGWDTDTRGGVLQTATIVDGHALQEFFPRSPVLGIDGGVGLLKTNTALGQEWRDIYVRWYTAYASNFMWPVSPAEDKTELRALSTGTSQNITFSSHRSGPSAIWGAYNEASAGWMWMNVGPDVIIQRQQWYCLELHIKKGSPGTFEGWVDGVQKWSYPSLNMGTGLIQQLMLLGTFAGGSPIDQYQWVDQFVVSDQRIGCLNSSPSPIPDVPPTIVASTSTASTGASASLATTPLPTVVSPPDTSATTSASPTVTAPPSQASSPAPSPAPTSSGTRRFFAAATTTPSTTSSVTTSVPTTSAPTVQTSPTSSTSTTPTTTTPSPTTASAPTSQNSTNSTATSVSTTSTPTNPPVTSTPTVQTSPASSTSTAPTTSTPSPTITSAPTSQSTTSSASSAPASSSTTSTVQTATASPTAQTISLTTTNSSTSIQTSSQTNMANECTNPSSAWIFCDDFETDRLTRYFEYVTANNSFTRLSGVGVGSSSAMRAQYQPGQSSAGNLKLAFGKTPDPYFKPVDNGLNRYREIYWRVYVKNQSGWTGGGGDKLSRAIVFANNNWAEAAIGHVWSGGPNSNYLLLDPTSGTDMAGNLQTTQYNDGANFRWLGYAQSSTPIFDSAHVGQWQCVEAHMKLNDSGQSNGVFELFVNGQLEVQRAGLNWVGSYSDYGINTIFVENYWNNTSPVVQERYIDNFVVSTQKIGCGTLPNTSSPSTSSPSTTVNPAPSTSSTPTPTVVSSPSPTTNPTTTQSSAATPTQGTTAPILSTRSTPFGSTPRPIPGRIEAEDFDKGGEGVGYHDLDAANQGGQYRPTEGVDIAATQDIGGGFKLGWTQAGEWLQYTVNVTTAGTYTVSARVSSSGAGGSFHVEFGGVDKTGPLTIPDTGGWENLQTVTKTAVNLTAGVQVMKVVFDKNVASGYVGNLNYIDVVTAPTVASTPSTTSTPTSTSTPVSFQGTGREAICSNPAVWACYDFEDGKLGPFTGGNFNISTTVKRGNYALDMFYPAVPNRPGSNGGSGFGGPTRGGAGTQEWHMRWYTYFTPNWVTGGFQKGWIIGDGNHPAAISSIYVMNHDYANPNPETLVQSLTLGQVLNPLSSPDSHLYLPNNLRAFPFTGSNLGRWVSVEVHIKLNTPGVYHDNRRNNDVWPGRAIYPPDTVRHPGDADGIYEAWIDGVKVAEYVNINYRGTLAGSYQDFILSGQWNCTGPPEAGENTCGPLTTSPHPDMHRYIDNIVIADGDTMIGP